MNTSICPKCHNTKDPRSMFCLGCAFPISKTKRCNGCGRTLPRNAFGIRPDGRGGHKRRSRCKECDAKATAVYRRKMSASQKQERKVSKRFYSQQNKALSSSQARIRNVKKWGGSPTKIKAYLENHNRTCDICGEHESVVGTLHIDHCHEKNVFRGLLCSTCNTGLGQFKDEIRRLTSAIEYLKRPLPILPEATISKIEIDERDGVAPERAIRGETVPWAKLKLEQVQEIKHQLEDGVEIAAIAKNHGVSRMAIYAIRSGKNWETTPNPQLIPTCP